MSKLRIVEVERVARPKQVLSEEDVQESTRRAIEWDERVLAILYER